MQGYVKVYRKMMCNPIWQDPYYLKIWMYCLMKASHKEHDQLVGSSIIKLKPGEFVTGRNSLSDDLNKGVKPKMKLNEVSWWRYLNNLEKWGMLHIKKTNKYSVVSILKWEEYQETEQQLHIKSTTTAQQLHTNKNVNNGENVKKKDSYSNEFEQFWLIYPRKVDKKKADKSFKTAIKKHSFEKIIEGTKRYSESVKGTETQYIKHASTFLNNESFIDGFENNKKQSKPEERSGKLPEFDFSQMG